MSVSDALRALATRWHERIVGTRMGDRTKSMLRGIAWVVPAAMVARVMTGVVSLLTARWLGPEDWGRTSLALAASLWLQVPLFLGIPAALMNAIPRAEQSERRNWARTGALLLSVTGVSTLLAGLLLREPLAVLAGMGVPEFLGGLTWCAGFLVYSAAIATLSGLELFKERALAELAFGVAFPAMVIGLHLSDRLSWQGYLGAMGGGYALAGIAVFAAGRAPLPGLDAGTAPRARRLLSFGAVATVSLVASALVLAVSRQVTMRHFAVEDVGVLAAYQGGSVQVATYVQALVSMVFFPIASRTPDRGVLFQKVARVLGPVTGLGTLGFGAILLLWMRLLGAEYPFDLATFAAFSAAAGLAMAYYILLWMLASSGAHGMAAATLTQVVNGVVNLAACLLLIPPWGVLGAGIAAALGMAAGIGCAFVPAVRRWADVS